MLPRLTNSTQNSFILNNLHTSRRKSSRTNFKHRNYRSNSRTYTQQHSESKSKYIYGALAGGVFLSLLFSDSGETVYADEPSEIKFERIAEAVMRDDVEQLKRLIKYSLTDEESYYLKEAIIFLAAEAGALNVSKWLVDTGFVDIYQRDENGNNVLHYATSCSNLELLDWLFEKKFRVDDKNNEGFGVISTAVVKGNLDVVKYLIEEKGGNPNEKNKIGSSALHLAVAFQQPLLVKYLIGVGADLNDDDNIEGLPPLMLIQDKESLKILLDYGANVNFKASNGITPLYLAAMLSPEATQLCIDAGADVNCISPDNVNAAFYAVANSQIESLKVLIKNGVDLNLRDTEGKSIAVYACQSLPVLKFLAEQGVPLNVRDNNNNTLLHVAAELNNVPILEYLLDKGLEIDARDQLGYTPLIHSILTNSMQAFKFLIRAGSDVNTLNEGGGSPLIIASYHCLPEIAKHLLLSGADKDLADFEANKTAYEWALESGCQEVLDILNEKPVASKGNNRLKSFARSN